MKQIWRFLLLFSVCSLTVETACSQAQIFKDLHEVKRKETIFGIARDNGLTVQELIDANPEMNQPGYELKKGDVVKIPFRKGEKVPQIQENYAPSLNQSSAAAQQTSGDMRRREIRVGIMLPLHKQNGDGRRMVEYYRGVLMACDSLKANGISTDIRAWNVAEDTDIRQILRDPQAATCDLIIGPLYDKHIKALSDFAKTRNIRVLIPFSTKSTEVYDNGNLFQVYQNGNAQNEAFVFRFYQRFKDCHPVIIDCNDTTSTKSGFTGSLRRKLEQEGVVYSITNLRSSEAMFQKCFSATKRNVVILNTSRSSELSVAFAKLNGMMLNNPNLQISMFGYPEWLQYVRSHLENFYKFDTYVPSTYYLNPLSPRSERIRQKYRWNFHQDMQNYPQRFAVTGFDHAFFFIKGMHLYGSRFTGASGMVGYSPIQTPLHFERIGNGGMLNRSLLFVHYQKNHRIETITF